MGIPSFRAAIADSALLVSPKIKTAAGCNSSKIGSIAINVLPMVSRDVLPAAAK